MLTRLLLVAGLGAALSSSVAGVSAQDSTSTPVSGCPSASQYQVRAYVDPGTNQLLYFWDITDASILPTIQQSSFVVRANQNSLDCDQNTGNTATGYYGLDLVSPTPAGLAAQYKTTLGGVQYCKQYSLHINENLKSGENCQLAFASVSVYPPSSTGSNGGSGSGSSTPTPTPLTCPTPDQYVATGSEVNGQLVFTFDVKDQATVDLIASGAFRLFQSGNPQQGSDLGILGLTKADVAPAGFAARFTSTYGPLQAGIEYDGHAVLSLKDSTICSTNGVSVTGAATTTTTPPTTGGTTTTTPPTTGSSGSGSDSGATTTPPTTTNPTTTPPSSGESNQPPTSSNPTSSNPTSGTFVPGSCPLFPIAQTVTRIPGTSAVAVAFSNGDSGSSPRPIEWVDFHVSINSALTVGGSSKPAPQYNYRMQKTDATSFQLVFPTGNDDVQLADTDYLNYFFTYCSEMVDCDTEGFNFQPQPAQGESQVPAAPAVVCPAVNFTQSATAVGSNGLTILFTEDTVDRTVDWVDVHAIITSGTVNGQFNYRMAQSQSNPKQFVHSFPTAIDTVTVPSDAVVTYFFTYCSQKTDCNTDYFSLHRQPETGALITSNEQCPVLQHESTVVRSTSNPSQLSLTFHPVNAQKVQNIGWVDVHVSINTALLTDGQGALVPQYNYRMQKQANGDFTYAFPGADGVTVPDTAYLQYFFTYCADLVDCNTEPETFGAVQAQRIAARVLAGEETSNSTSTGPVVISASSSTGVAGKNATVIRPGFASSSTGVAGTSNDNNIGNGNKNGAAAVAASSVLVFALAIGSALLM